MKRGWGATAIFAVIGLASATGAMLVFDASRQAILERDAWRGGMEVAAFIESELDGLEAVLAGRANREAVEDELHRLALVGDIYHFEFRNADGQLVFATGAYHPASGKAAEHHAHQHAGEEPAADQTSSGAPAGEGEPADMDLNHPNSANDGINFQHLPVSDGHGHVAQHQVKLMQGDGTTTPPTYARVDHPMHSENGTLRGTISLFVDLGARASLIDGTLLTTALLVLVLFLVAVSGPVWFYVRTLRQKRSADEKVHFLATSDVLTNLLNRNTFVARLDEAASQSMRHAVHFVDVDEFKHMNDRYGHDAGDLVLKEVARRLQLAGGAGVLVSRFGGDEFALLQTNLEADKDAENLAEAIVRTVGQPVEVNGSRLEPTISMGTAIAPKDARTPDKLMKCADLAMYQAKESGRNRSVVYENWMDEKMARRREVEDCLRWALENEGFELHYQPIFKSNNETLSGFEALLRLKDARGEAISPEEFIPLAEQLRLIAPIGEWVLKRACQAATSWPDDLVVSVNLSIGQFTSGNLLSEVRSALEETGLQASRLELEVTESMLMVDEQSVVHQLEQLRELGISIAMDDFGTGYSSLSQLWRFPFDKIKIDGSFIAAYDEKEPHITQIVKTIVGLGHTMEMDITAEGVENDDQLMMLRNIGCDSMQGFLLGRPVPQAELAALVAREASKQLASKEPQHTRTRSRR